MVSYNLFIIIIFIGPLFMAFNIVNNILLEILNLLGFCDIIPSKFLSFSVIFSSFSSISWLLSTDGPGVILDSLLFSHDTLSSGNFIHSHSPKCQLYPLLPILSLSPPSLFLFPSPCVCHFIQQILIDTSSMPGIMLSTLARAPDPRNQFDFYVSQMHLRFEMSRAKHTTP